MFNIYHDVWMLICAILLWVYFYKDLKKHAPDNNSTVDGFEMIMIAIISVVISVIVNLALVMAGVLLWLSITSPWKTLVVILCIAFSWGIFKGIDSAISGFRNIFFGHFDE